MEKTSWQGRYYEDFEVGDLYRHRLGRTVTESDNSLFTMLTLNTNPIHFDAEYAGRTEFGRILVNSCFTLSLAVGLSVSDLSEHVMANLGWTDVLLPNPVFVGDTVRAHSEILSKRESKSRPNAGIVEAKSVGENQRGEIVVSYRRTFLVYKRGCGPNR
jgi:itaconyl-CoA hydratase